MGLTPVWSQPLAVSRRVAVLVTSVLVSRERDIGRLPLGAVQSFSCNGYVRFCITTDNTISHVTQIISCEVQSSYLTCDWLNSSTQCDIYISSGKFTGKFMLIANLSKCERIPIRIIRELQSDNKNIQCTLHFL